MNPHFDTKIISHHQIRQCIHDLHASGAEFGLFVLIGDCPDSYQTIKRCALQEFGIITLCCDLGSIRKQNNPGKLVNFIFFFNISIKYFLFFRMLILKMLLKK
jgi:hypothetical protein